MSTQLKRQLGIGASVTMGLGSMIGSGVFIGLAMVAEQTGPAIILACVLAGIIALFNAFSMAQLARAHPVSGGVYTYATVFIHPKIGFIAGWLFLLAKITSAATAAIGIATYIQPYSLLPRPVTAVLLIGVITGVALLAIRQAYWVIAGLVSVTLVALAIFVITGYNTVTLTMMTPFFSTSLASFGHGVAIAFVSYAGYGRIATLGEEVLDPDRTITRAIAITLGSAVIIYSLVATVAMGSLGYINVRLLHSAMNPLIIRIMAIGATTAMISVLLNLILGLSRTIVAMSRRGDLPAIFMRLNRHQTTPYYAVMITGCLIALLAGLTTIRMTWSLSALSVALYYAISNWAAIRLYAPTTYYTAWFGLIGCLSLLIWVNATTWVIVLMWLILASGMTAIVKRLKISVP